MALVSKDTAAESAQMCHMVKRLVFISHEFRKTLFRRHGLLQNRKSLAFFQSLITAFLQSLNEASFGCEEPLILLDCPPYGAVHS